MGRLIVHPDDPGYEEALRQDAERRREAERFDREAVRSMWESFPEDFEDQEDFGGQRRDEPT